MAAEWSASFAELLRRARLAAGLTQEALAELAGISPDGIQKLERGTRRPQRETARRLVAALRLGGADARAFEAATSSPRLRTAQRREEAGPASHTLPFALTSFVGRQAELAEATRLFQTARLLTLTGAGGCGKTRLALELAAALAPTYADGVVLVELAALSDPRLVPPAVALALGVRETTQEPLVVVLTAAMRDRQLLLLLDNCEHLLDACAQLAETLLRGCQHLRLLATSREPLRAAGEVRYRVPSLAIPPPDAALTPEMARQYPAVQLFLERAQAALPTIALTPATTPAIRQVCAQLDGMPLAIELAAARLEGLGLEELARRLEQRFHLLTVGGRAALPRQQTLRAAIDWSYDLLGQQERRLFRRLSVFAEGFTLAAAEAVCDGAGGEPLDVADLLPRLVDKSLVVAGETEPLSSTTSQLRYRLLETVRQYARERLAASGETPTTAERHAACYLALAEEAMAQPTGGGSLVVTPPAPTNLRRMVTERANLRSALNWLVEQQDVDQALRLGAALGRFWISAGPAAEGRQALAAVLALSGAVATLLRADVLQCAARLAIRSQGDYREALAPLQESIASARVGGDRTRLGRYLMPLGSALAELGDYAQALTCFAEVLTLCQELDDAWGSVMALSHLAYVARLAGDYPQSRTYSERGVAAARALGDRPALLGNALLMLALTVCAQGDYPLARSVFTEAQTLHKTAGAGNYLFVLWGLGRVAFGEGDFAEARSLYRQALARGRRGKAQSEPGDLVGESVFILSCGAAAVELSEPEQATRLLAAATTLRARSGSPLPPTDRSEYERALASVRAALSDDAFAAAWAAGEAMTEEQAIAAALTDDEGR